MGDAMLQSMKQINKDAGCVKHGLPLKLELGFIFSCLDAFLTLT